MNRPLEELAEYDYTLAATDALDPADVPELTGWNEQREAEDLPPITTVYSGRFDGPYGPVEVRLAHSTAGLLDDPSARPVVEDDLARAALPAVQERAADGTPA